jgi:hypothetical protein
MATCAAQGVFGKILLEPKTAEGDADPTFDGSSERYTFLYETMKAERELVGTRSIYGTRSQYQTQLSKVPYTPKGMLGLQPGPLDLDLLLPRILGEAESTDVFALSETLPIFDMLIYRDNGTFHYKNNRINQALFQGRSDSGEDEGNIVSLNMQVIGMDEVTTTSWPGTIPAVPVSARNAPYIFSQGVLTIGATEYPIDEFKLSINNMLQIRHRNSLKPTCVFSAGREINLEIRSPFTAAAYTMMDSLYSTSSSATLVFTNGNMDTTFTFPALRSVIDPPTVRGKGEIPLSIKLQAFRTAGALELEITNDSTT